MCNFRFLLTVLILSISSCSILYAQNTDSFETSLPIDNSKEEPIKYTGDVISDKHYYDGRLRYAIGVHNYQAMRANRTNPPEGGGIGWTYNHAPNLAYWKGRFYLHYLSNPVHEHGPPGRTMLMTSIDGINWSKPRIAFPKYALPKINRHFESLGDIDLPMGTYSVMHQRMGFYVAPNGKLLTLGFYSFSVPPYGSPNRGQGLGRVVREINEDGTLGPVYFIRYNRDAGWNETNTNFPFYTLSADKEFIEACEALLSDNLMTLQWREEDMPDEDFYKNDPDDEFKAFIWTYRPDSVLVGVMKGQQSTLSFDHGNTWTERQTNSTLFTNGAKVWIQKTNDDRYALVYNHSVTRNNRFPMTVMTSDDAHQFDNILNLNGEVPPMRYIGAHKNTGSQYFRGIVPGNGNPPGNDMWNVYSMNKEDMWISRTPVPVRGTVDEHVFQNFQDVNDISELDLWNLYIPQWAPISIVEDPAKFDNKVLELRDEEPYDYAIAQRAFPESERVTVEFDVYIQQAGTGSLYVEVQNKQGKRPTSLRFDENYIMMDRGSVDPDPLPLETDKWIHIRMDLDCEKQLYSLYIDGEKIYEVPFGEEVDSLERLVFRTGAWRGDVRQFIVDGEPDSKGWYLEDLPGSDERTTKSVFLIDNVETY